MSAIFDEDKQHIDPVTGDLLVGGKVYIGDPGVDPKDNAKNVYSVRALTGAAIAQPLIIGSDGRVSTKMWVSGKYSYQIDSSADVQKYQELDNGIDALIGNSLTINSTGDNAIIAEGSPTIASLVDGQAYLITVPSNTTGEVTLKIDSTPITPVKKYHDVALSNGDLKAGQKLLVLYNADDDVFEAQVTPRSASGITNLPTGNISSTDQQDVNNELAIMASPVDSMQSLIALDVAKTQFSDMLSFLPDLRKGGGGFWYDADAIRTTHNGITIISPARTIGSWNAAAQTAWFAAVTNTDTGCWIKTDQLNVTIYHAGWQVGVDSTTIKTAYDAYDYALTQSIIASSTVSAKTWYVDPVDGFDLTGKGRATGAAAYKTLQYAYDQLPNFIFHQQTIQLADGTYNTNYLSATQSVAMPRPSILFGRGKFVANRTQKNGDNMEGGIVIKGNASTPANVLIEPNNTYSYGIYNAQGQIALQDFTIKSASDATNVVNLLTSHRHDSYVHTYNVSLDGVSKSVTSVGMLAESGGKIEFAAANAANIINCGILIQALTPGSHITPSGKLTISGCNTGLSLNRGCGVNFVSSFDPPITFSNCSDLCVDAFEGSIVKMQGTSDNPLKINGDVNLKNGSIGSMLFVDIDGKIDLYNSVLKLNNSNYQDVLTAYASDLWFTGSDSFISPATANDSTIPVRLLDGSNIFAENTNRFTGSSGDGLHCQDGKNYTVAADNTELSVPPGVYTSIRLAAAADRTGVTLSAGSYQYQKVELFNYSAFSVEIVESSTATISNNTVKLSNQTATDQHIGVSFIWHGTKWREVGRSRANA